MDHIPIPSHATHTEVPYLCTEEYHNNQGWSDFPRQKRWNKSELLECDDIGGRTEHELISFLQTWLFFGLLFETCKIIGQRVQMSDFIAKTPSGKKIITTKLLPQILKNWHDVEIQRQGFWAKLQRCNRIESIRSILEEATLWFSKYCEFPDERLTIPYSSPYFKSPLPREVALSILSLATTISSAAMFILSELKEPLSPQLPSVGANSILYDRFLGAGWCRKDIWRMQEIGVNCAYFMSCFPGIRTGMSHANCTEQSCKGEVANEEQYVTRHTTSSCNCAMVEIPIASVADILRGGSIPLVTYGRGVRADQSALKLTQYQDGLRYVAISHIWRQGMGNPRTNALPACQLARVQALVNKLLLRDDEESNPNQADTPFWIDVLCCPRPKEYTSAKTMAIRAMRKTYEQAEQILVLDNDLADLSTFSSLLEIFGRIVASEWMQRLWTLQEGFVARGLSFQLGDGLMNIDMVDDIYYNPWDSSMPADLRQFIGAMLSPFAFPPRIMRDGVSEEVLGNYLASKVAWRTILAFGARRTTTNADDETVCFATMLQIDPGPLFGVHGMQRMAKFLELVKEAPSLILFGPGPRLLVQGYEWAPRSFLIETGIKPPFSLDWVEPSLFGDMCPIEKNGNFTVRFPGLTVSKAEKFERWTRTEEKERWFWYEGLVQVNKGLFVKDFDLWDTKLLFQDADPPAFHDEDEFAIILQCELRHGGSGVLVQVQDERRGTKLVRYICPVIFQTPIGMPEVDVMIDWTLNSVETDKIQKRAWCFSS